MPKTKLTCVTRAQGNNRALRDFEIGMPDFEFAFEEVNPLPKAFRRMVRDGAWDVSEMALATYICARAHGSKLTALPIFLVRDFHHKSMVRSLAGDVAGPTDLPGREVGVNRGYTVTTGVWARAILADEYGVDPGDVTWMRSGEEHVAGYVPPANVGDLESGTLEEHLADGRLGAAVGLAESSGCVPLIEDAFGAGVTALKGRGLYPINHLVVVRDDVLKTYPEVAVQVFDAFAASKRIYVNNLKTGRIGALSPLDKVHLAALEVMDDPLPYGVAPNLAVLEMLMDHAVAQGIVGVAQDIAGMFAPAVREMTG